MAAGMTRIGCVIMASGQGRRFGGNKLMATLTGKPLIDYILQATEGLFQRRVVVTRHESVRQYCLSQGAEVLFHCEPERSDTIRFGIEAMADCTHCLFCMGDQPLVKRKSLEKIIEAAKEQPDKIWRFEADGTAAAPVLFPRRFFHELAALSPGEGGGYVIRQHREEVCTMEVDACELIDIDTAADLAAVEKMTCEFPGNQV